MLATARLLCCSAALRACCAYLLCFPTCLQGAQVSARSVEEQTRATSTARSYLEKGKRAFAAQNLAEAQAQLELAVEADPKLDEAHFALGILELQRGEATAAIPHFRKVIELAPKSFQGHYHLALAYVRDQKLQEGAEELERAVAINPRHADAAEG